MARQTKVVGVSFQPETLDRITKAAEADRRSRSIWIALACEEKLARDTAAQNKSLQEPITTKAEPSAGGII